MGRLPLILALVYDVLPVDLVPDVIPVMGLVDDAGVTGVALFFCAAGAPEIDRSRGWVTNHDQATYWTEAHHAGLV